MAQYSKYVLMYCVAVGCPQLAEPIGGWVKQDSEEAVLGCHSDVDNTWRLVCHGSTWIGDHRNCTNGTWLYRDAPFEILNSRRTMDGGYLE